MSDLPEVHDEASPTPVWIPVIGVLVFAALSLAALVRGAMPNVDAHAARTTAEGVVAPDDAPSDAE